MKQEIDEALARTLFYRTLAGCLAFALAAYVFVLGR